MCKKLVFLIAFALMLSLVLASVTSAANNLIGWWKLDGDTLDYSGLGNDGIASGNSTFVAGTVGSGALDVDGTDAYVSVPSSSSLQLTSALTIAGWIKADSWDSGNDVDPIARKGEGNPNNYQLAVVDGRATLYLDGGEADDDGFEGNTPLNTGQWYHIAATWDGLTVRIYVDGVVDNDPSDLRGDTLGTDTRPFYIGGRSGADLFDGTLDDIRIYNRALSDAQASGLFNGIDPIFVKAENPEPADGATYEDTWASLGWEAGETAVTHDVYMSDNFDDVNDGIGDSFRGNQALPFLTAGFFGFPYPDGLVPGTAYYWRVDEVEADGTTKYRGNVWSFWIPPRSAYDPSPSDGGRFVGTDVTLGWTAGFGAKLHTVYFGDNFDDVSNAAAGMPAATTTFAPGTLELDKTYYWRVDEFNPPATVKGDVWSFETLPVISITDPDLVGWWTFDEGNGNTAIDWSGHGNDGTLGGDPQWVDGIMKGALDLTSDYVSIDAVADDITTNDITLSAWIKTTQAGEGNVFASNTGGSHVLLFGIDNGNIYVDDGPSTDWPPAVNDDQWHMVTFVLSGPRITLYTDGVQVASIATTIDITSETRWSIGQEWDSDPSDFYRGMVDDARFYNKALTADEVRQIMRGDLLLAWNPSPADNSTSDVLRAASVSWSAGDSASQHAVYFGTDRDAVAGADTSDTIGVFRGLQAGASYTVPEGVEWAGGPYYWRIDENNTDGTVSEGNVWSFTLANHLIVDDFESYNDFDPPDAASNRIFDKWIDGFGTTTNGAVVGNDLPPYAERGVVHGGGQSMPHLYDTNLKIAESTLALVSPRDWTAQGVTKLSLWFRGDAANAAERMFVALDGVAEVYHDDPAATQIDGWTEWVIDLSAFGGFGVNLTNVSTITIGFGTKGSPAVGGTGQMYFDDIRLIQ